MLVDAQKQTVGTGAVSAFGLSHYGNSLFCPKQPRFRNTCEKCGLASRPTLHRAGELTAIWVPDPGHEAVRDLVRARDAAMEDLREKRQHLQAFLLRHGRIYPGLN